MKPLPSFQDFIGGHKCYKRFFNYCKTPREVNEILKKVIYDISMMSDSEIAKRGFVGLSNCQGIPCDPDRKNCIDEPGDL
jgi:hypothetical protein